MRFKFVSLIALITAMVIVFAACAGQAQPAAPAEPAPPPAAEETVETPAAEAEAEPAPEPEPEPETDDTTDAVTGATMDANDVQIALVAHSPDSILDDGSFNQGAWDGIQRFINNHGLPAGNAQFFQPHEGSDVARIDLIEGVISGGANILVLPGFHFINSSYDLQDMFPDVMFVLLDASPARDNVVRVQPNLAAIHYAEEQAGFLAGYAAVMEGYRNLGFTGGIPVPAVVRYGHGFIEGAEFAAASLGLEPGEVTINYHYFGAFAPDPAFAVTASAWFAAGTEIIFAAAGGAGANVFSAAEGAGASVIGVDVDQGHLSESVITSAVKGLDVSVYDMIAAFWLGTFQGGELRFDASNNGIGLSMASSRMQNFTQAQYENIFEQLASGAISVSSSEVLSEILENISLVVVTEL